MNDNTLNELALCEKNKILEEILLLNIEDEFNYKLHLNKELT